MSRKKRNYKQKLLYNLKSDKILSWKEIEAITGYTRQNIDYAFKNNVEKTIDKVLELLNEV